MTTVWRSSLMHVPTFRNKDIFFKDYLNALHTQLALWTRHVYVKHTSIAYHTPIIDRLLDVVRGLVLKK
jgi:hypothetical protein